MYSILVDLLHFCENDCKEYMWQITFQIMFEGLKLKLY